jgi:D-alanyl-D-alanine carboxypeptidase (penicillin-binding protein 5/6)
MQPRPLTPPKKRRRSRRKQLILSLIVLVLASAYGALAILKPFAELTPSIAKDSLTITTPASNVPWPNYGQGAYGLANGTVIATHGEQTPVAIASVAKVINALVILDRHPIAAGTDGPVITLTDRDVSLYDKYLAIDGSVMPVRSGMKLTERQMLQALLLPSANNIADSLALWSFGSIGAYKTYAMSYLQKHGLMHTTVGGDASGYLPDSTSTASDLVKLGALAMSNPVLAEVVSQKTAVIPSVGTVRNYNNLLGTNGITGVKTGNNDENGGVFVGATTARVNGKTVTLISALSGAPTLDTVLRDSGSLLATIRTTFAETNIVKKGTVLGTYAQANGSQLQAVAGDNLSLTVFRGSTVTATIKLDPVSYNAVKGQTVGRASITATDFSPAVSVPIVLAQTPTKPSISYRLLHP